MIMNTQGIILHMISVVEDYIYKMKGVRVSINPVVIFFNQDQLDKLIDAFNHVKDYQMYIRAYNYDCE
jgi:hypothetical protein